MTEVIPQASDVFPWLVAFSNTASVDDVVAPEKAGPVMAPVLQPSTVRVTAHAVIVGGVVSLTLMV